MKISFYKMLQITQLKNQLYELFSCIHRIFAMPASLKLYGRHIPILAVFWNTAGQIFPQKLEGGTLRRNRVC